MVTHTERRVEVPLAAGWQNDQHTATGIARVDRQLWNLDVCLKRSVVLSQPAKARQNEGTKVTFTGSSNWTI
jgi:hypothetical protein